MLEQAAQHAERALGAPVGDHRAVVAPDDEVGALALPDLVADDRLDDGRVVLVGGLEAAPVGDLDVRVGQRGDQVVDAHLVLDVDVDDHQRGAVVDGVEAALAHLAERQGDQPVGDLAVLGDAALQRDVEERLDLRTPSRHQPGGALGLAADHRPRLVPLDLVQEVADSHGVGHGRNPSCPQAGTLAASASGVPGRTRRRSRTSLRASAGRSTRCHDSTASTRVIARTTRKLADGPVHAPHVDHQLLHGEGVEVEAVGEVAEAGRPGDVRRPREADREHGVGDGDRRQLQAPARPHAGHDRLQRDHRHGDVGAQPEPRPGGEGQAQERAAGEEHPQQGGVAQPDRVEDRRLLLAASRPARSSRPPRPARRRAAAAAGRGTAAARRGSRGTRRTGSTATR